MAEKRRDPISQFADLQEQLRESMKPIADMQRELQKAMKPIADIQKQMQGIQIPVFRKPEFDSAVQKILEDRARFTKGIENLGLGSASAVAKKMAQIGRNTQALDDSGWLPHYSTPFAVVEECNGDTAALQARLEKHYQDGWQNIRRDIETRLTSYDIDDEAKATFREALTAHETGLYRSVCRVLLPEIERVARIELHGDKLERITSQPLLRELAGYLSLASIEPKGLYCLNLFRHLTGHLYENINTEADRQRFAQDPVPNRHAAAHGLVSYSSMQNSLNTVFMADYIFQVISFLKNPSSASRSTESKLDSL